MKNVFAALPLLAVAMVTSLAYAEEIKCYATEKDSDKVIARTTGTSAVKCTIDLGKKVKESSFCNSHKGEKHELLNHSNKTVMGNQVKPSKLVVTCPK